MQHGARGKGRPKGSPNKRTRLSVSAILAEKGIAPVDEILKILPRLEDAEAAKVWLKLQEYIEPKAMVPVIQDEDTDAQLRAVGTNNLVSIVKNEDNP